MDFEELQPRKHADYLIGNDLSGYSIAELTEIAATLKAETARVEQALRAKQAERSAAQSLFKR